MKKYLLVLLLLIPVSAWAWGVLLIGAGSGEEGGCSGGSDGELTAGATVQTQATCYDLSLDCTTNGIFVYTITTPDEDGTVSYAHFDSYDCDNGVRSAVFTLDGDNVTTRVTGCDSTLGDGTDAKPEAWDLSISGECCLQAGTSYAVGVWCESDGDAYNGAYNSTETDSGIYAVGMNTFGTSWDHDNAEEMHGSRMLVITLDNTAP